MEAGEARLPDKQRNLALAHRLPRLVIGAYETWIKEVESAIGVPDGPRD